MLFSQNDILMNLTKNAMHFFVRCSYTDRSISSTIANLFRIGIVKNQHWNLNNFPEKIERFRTSYQNIIKIANFKIVIL